MIDHRVRDDEVEKLLLASQSSQQKIQFIDYQMLKKTNLVTDSSNKPKSKIFIKDVTLLRKPDLPNDINLPNIFDSLDLTTTDDHDIFDDFLAEAEPADFEFDFEEPNVSIEQDDEIIATSEILDNSHASMSGKIYVRKNLLEEASKTEVTSSEVKAQSFESSTSKIYVRSHESLTSQVTEVPQPSSTPDCVIVSSEIIKEAPATNKIFIRDIETLTNPQDKTYFDDSVTNPTTNFLSHSTTNYANAFTPSIYVRSYDSLVNDANQPIPTATTESTQPRCKISIKNMNTLIEPTLMHPPSLGIFGQAQNLVIHMRPNTTDENLISFRDTSMTPDTLPGSSNVSTCGGTDDVIILDDSEINDSSFTTFADAPDIENNLEPNVDPISVANDEKIQNEEVVLENQEIENPERNQTPNDKPKINIPPELPETVEDQPMTRIPMTSLATVTNESDTVKETPKKKMKIIKIIRIKKKSPTEDENTINPLDSVRVVFKCNIGDCTQHFSNAKLLNYHKRCHYNINQIVCPECGSQAFKNYNTLHTHLWRTHSIDMDLFKCKLCHFKTPILSRLKNFHQKIHSNEKNFKCDYANCNKRFKNSKQLKNHSQTHKTVKQTNVTTQSSDNDSTKKIRCQICNKGFSSESGLYIHFMEHKNEEKRFMCEEKGCEYSTNDHNSFRRHKFQHSKTHQYTCPACDYKSIQSNTYRKHLEKQHKELAESLLFKCGSCKFVTISKSKYDGHVAKHYGDA